jgi:hypothetical protein
MALELTNATEVATLLITINGVEVIIKINGDKAVVVVDSSEAAEVKLTTNGKKEWNVSHK